MTGQEESCVACSQLPLSSGMLFVSTLACPHPQTPLPLQSGCLLLAPLYPSTVTCLPSSTGLENPSCTASGISSNGVSLSMCSAFDPVEIQACMTRKITLCVASRGRAQNNKKITFHLLYTGGSQTALLWSDRGPGTVLILMPTS